MNPPKTHSVAELWALIDIQIQTLPAITLPLEDAAGCILAENIFADADQPAFDRSAVDGFAVPAGSNTGSFAIIGEVLPGDIAPATPGLGQAWRVFTGSAVPADSALVMLEQTEVSAGLLTSKGPATTEHIRRRASSARAGARLLNAGARIGAGEAAVLASVGATFPKTVPRPRTLHITTGREILAAHATPAAGQIRDTNGPLIRALLAESNAVALPRIHVDESIASLVAAVEKAGEFDLLLVSGGSSEGAHDRTPQALEALGFSLLTRRVNARPGKPLLVARRGKQWAFGLPGNPVSHFATYHVFVSRALRRLAGRPVEPSARARLGSGAQLATNSRETFWPARLDRSTDSVIAHPLHWLDSGDLTALIGVDALIRLPSDPLPAVGDEVEIVLCHPPHQSFLS